MVNGEKYKKFVLRQQDYDFPGQFVGGALQRFFLFLLFVIAVLDDMIISSRSTSSVLLQASRVAGAMRRAICSCVYAVASSTVASYLRNTKGMTRRNLLENQSIYQVICRL